MFERMHVITALLAGLLVTLFSIIYNIQFDILVMRLSITICVFYVLGSMAKAYLKRKVFVNKSSYFLEEDVLPNPKPEEDESVSEESDTEDLDLDLEDEEREI